jgi:hypothetical protein
MFWHCSGNIPLFCALRRPLNWRLWKKYLELAYKFHGVNKTRLDLWATRRMDPRDGTRGHGPAHFGGGPGGDPGLRRKTIIGTPYGTPPYPHRSSRAPPTLPGKPKTSLESKRFVYNRLFGRDCKDLRTKLRSSPRPPRSQDRSSTGAQSRGRTFSVSIGATLSSDICTCWLVHQGLSVCGPTRQRGKSRFTSPETPPSGVIRSRSSRLNVTSHDWHHCHVMVTRRHWSGVFIRAGLSRISIHLQNSKAYSIAKLKGLFDSSLW